MVQPVFRIVERGGNDNELKIYNNFGAIALVILNLSAFTINERELAIKLQVGEVVKADYEPGLHLKSPFTRRLESFQKNYDNQ